MLPKIQRSKVESKSQHKLYSIKNISSCYQKYKDQKLKANHPANKAGLLKIQRTKVESKSQQEQGNAEVGEESGIKLHIT